MPGGALSSEHGRGIGTEGLRTLVAYAASHGLQLISSVVVSQALGPQGRGEFVLLVTLGVITYQVASLGTERAVFRLWGEMPQARPSLWPSVTRIAALTSLPMMVLAIAAVRGALARWVGEPATLPLVLAAASVPFLTHTLLLSSLNNARGRLQETNRAFLLGVGLTSGILVSLASMGRLDVTSAMTAVLVGHVSTWGWLAWSARVRILGPRSRSVGRKLSATAFALAPASALVNLSSRADLVLLGRLAGVKAVGIYSVALAVAQILWLATDALGAAVGARQMGESSAGLAAVTAKAVRMSLALTVIGGIPLLIVGPWLIGTAYGAAFRPAGGLLVLLLPAAGATAVWRAASSAVLRLRGPGAQTAASAAGLGVLVATGIAVIPSMGAEGAAVASLLAAVARAGVMNVFLIASTSLSLRQLLPGRDELIQLIHFRKLLL